MPLMHQGINQRLSNFNEKWRPEIRSTRAYEHIDNFSIRDYFKIDLIFKLFFFFILFGIHMKGLNLPIFIVLLVGYYWYYLNMDINAFYDKKISEIKLTKEEKKEVKDMIMKQFNCQETDFNKILESNSEESKLNNKISKEDKQIGENHDIIVEDEQIQNNQMKMITNLKDNDDVNHSTYNQDDKINENEGTSNQMKNIHNKDKILKIQKREGVIK
jgi:hypothetical protein